MGGVPFLAGQQRSTDGVIELTTMAYYFAIIELWKAHSGTGQEDNSSKSNIKKL